MEDEVTVKADSGRPLRMRSEERGRKKVSDCRV